MITDPKDFFAKGCGRCARFGTPDCSVHLWAEGLAALRALCREAGLEETARWGHPCYTHAGRNIALIGAFRSDFRLTLMAAALLDDSSGLMTQAGPNTPHPNVVRFTSATEVQTHADALRDLLAQATDHARAGQTAPREAASLHLPDEMTAALDADPELAEAFHALTPGRQRSYAIALNGAKQSATRLSRIARFRGRILAGKGAQER